MRALLVLLFLAMGCASGQQLVEQRATRGTSDRLAVLLTGDGGWRRVDQQVAKYLRADGIDVVGFSTPDYFRERRTPEESAAALERVIRDYMQQWGKRRIVLVGYSRGADVLPFMASRLPQDLRDAVDVIALLGAEPMIDFKYHPSWIPFHHPHEKQFPVLPEIEKLRGQRIICIYGDREKSSLCPMLDPSLATIVRKPGGHHFAGHYDAIAAEIVKAAR